MRWAMTTTAGAFAVNAPLFQLPENLALDSSMRLLDIGCGGGMAMRLLDERVGFDTRPTGIDFAPAALALARCNMGDRPQPSLAQASATHLPFAPGSFDLVLCGYVLQRLDDDQAAALLTEIRRVLAEGGLALIWEFAPTGNERLDAFNRRVLSRGVAEPRLRSTRALLSLAEQSGFEFTRDTRLRPFLLPPIRRASILVGRSPDERLAAGYVGITELARRGRVRPQSPAPPRRAPPPSVRHGRCDAAMQ